MHSSDHLAFWTMKLSLLGDSPPGDEHVEDVVLLDVVDGLLVRDHGEVVAVELEDLVVNSEPGSDGGTVGGNLRHVNAVV